MFINIGIVGIHAQPTILLVQIFYQVNSTQYASYRPISAMMMSKHPCSPFLCILPLRGTKKLLDDSNFLVNQAGIHLYRINDPIKNFLPNTEVKVKFYTKVQLYMTFLICDGREPTDRNLSIIPVNHQ